MKENDWTKEICEILREQNFEENIYIDVLKKIPYAFEISSFDEDWGIAPDAFDETVFETDMVVYEKKGYHKHCHCEEALWADVAISRYKLLFAERPKNTAAGLMVSGYFYLLGISGFHYLSISFKSDSVSIAQSAIFFPKSTC